MLIVRYKLIDRCRLSHIEARTIVRVDRPVEVICATRSLLLMLFIVCLCILLISFKFSIIYFINVCVWYCSDWRRLIYITIVFSYCENSILKFWVESFEVEVNFESHFELKYFKNKRTLVKCKPYSVSIIFINVGFNN